ncbi:MAG: potassium transporter TrkG, partial [Myxococcota bacterium]
GFKSDPVTCLDIAFLIILGGIGFPVLINLREGTRLWLTGKGRLWKLTFNSKVVLSFTAGLLVAGTLLMLFFEWDNTLAGLSLGDKLVNAFFQSVTPRTAGYNTVPIGDLHMISLFGIIILMFIGASPQSTGGGVKTTAFGTIVFTVRALLRNREHVEAFRRTLPPTFIYRAAALVFISMSLCVLSLMCLLITENATFMDMVFEVVSAFGTVGLSTGLTPKLTVAGKLVIIVTMLVGRIGPLTLAVALAARPTAGRFRYPDDHVIIG